MRIINQSRDVSYDFESSTMTLQGNAIFLRNNYTNSGHGYVGVYEDEIRAQEVFVDIHKNYCMGDKNYFMPEK